MKFWPVIRHVRYLLSPHWKYFIKAMKQVDSALQRELLDLAVSWLEDAKYEWEHLQAIRDGKE